MIYYGNISTEKKGGWDSLGDVGFHCEQENVYRSWPPNSLMSWWKQSQACIFARHRARIKIVKTGHNTNVFHINIDTSQKTLDTSLRAVAPKTHCLKATCRHFSSSRCLHLNQPSRPVSCSLIWLFPIGNEDHVPHR